MSDQIPPQEMPPSDDLQFDNAEYAAEAPAALTCAACSKLTEGTYYEVNGKALCDPCRSAVVAQLGGGLSPARFMRACLFGTLAAFVGFLIYFAVLKFTGIQAALISILVGLMVGGAVRAGSHHRGGLGYQLLAVLLTYCAVGASYAAIGIMEMASHEERPMGGAQAAPRVKAPKPADPAAQPGEAVGDGAEAVEEALAAEQQIRLQSNPIFLLFMIVFFTITSPVLANLDSPIGLLIVAFGLWEAWKLNKRAKLVFNGPFQAGGQAAAPAPGLAPHA